MKKLIILKLIIVLVLIASCDFLYIKYFNIKNDNDELIYEIKKAKLKIDKANLDVELTKASVEKLKEEKKDSVWELDSWKLMKEKIENAL